MVSKRKNTQGKIGPAKRLRFGLHNLRRRIGAVGAIVFVALFFLGCNLSLPRSELDDLAIVLGVGIDVSPDDPDEVMLTLVVARAAIDGEVGQGIGINTITSAGLTVFDALRKVAVYRDYVLFCGHNEYILLGEELAKRGLEKYLRVFYTDYAFQTDCPVMIVRGMTAHDFLAKQGKDVGKGIEHIVMVLRDRDMTSLYENVHVTDIVKTTEVFPRTVLVPYVVIGNSSPLKREDEEEASVEGQHSPALEPLGDKMIPLGYAVFQHDRLQDFLDEEQMLGVNWLLHQVQSSGMVLSDSAGDRVSLDVLRSRCDIRMQKEDGQLCVVANLNVESVLNEMFARGGAAKDESDNAMFARMEDIQRQMITATVNNTLQHSLQKNYDLLDLYSRVVNRHNTRWDVFTDDWEGMYPKTKFTVRVNCRITSSFNVRDPWQEEIAKQ